MKKVRYCGNCNPDEHPGDVREKLETLFPDDVDLSIIVDGCAKACLSKKRPDLKEDPGTIVVSSREVMRRKKK